MTDKTLSNQIEQYVTLGKSAKGASVADLIKIVLEAPNLYVFGELLDLPAIAEISKGEYEKFYNALNLFAFGTYKDYRYNISKYPELNSAMLRKLKALTVISLSLIDKRIPYSTLLEELDMKNTRELEDLIIEIIYAKIIEGKLDQRNQRLEVEFSIGRDVTPSAIKDMIKTLEFWSSNCENMESNIEKQASLANGHKTGQIELQSKINTEVSNIKQSLKTTQQTDNSEAEQMVTESNMSPMSEKLMKKGSKSKVRTGSGRLFGK